MTIPRRILLLSVSAGAGHVRAAQALCACAEHMHGVTTLHLDAMNYVPASFRKIYADFYIKLASHHPELWGMLYKVSDEAKPGAPLQKLRRAMERLSSRALRRAVREFAPDAIICTHFLPAELLMHEIRRARLSVPVWVQVTDFDLHRMWVIPYMSGYFAANDEIAFRMQCNGIPADIIHTTGIPIMPAFSEPLSRAACAAEFGLDASRQTFLLMGGGVGIGGLDQVGAKLLALPGDFQLIVLAGRNTEALAALQALAQQYPQRLFPVGFTDQVERWMACADLVITKPGGLTTSECLAMGRPMLVHSPIPGQEERNADFLLEQGAALKAVDDIALVYRIRQLAAHPGKLAQMGRRSHALGRPQAAKAVLGQVLGALAEY